MSGFCPDDWHQTTETDLQHMALGGGDYEYAVWESEMHFHSSPRSGRLDALIAKQKIVTDKAHAMAERLGLVPYSTETFECLMQEVERTDAMIEAGKEKL